MEHRVIDNQFDQAKNWFENLRNQLIKIISEIDGNEFINTNWDHSVYIDTDEPRIALLGCFKYEKTLAISDDLSYN